LQLISGVYKNPPISRLVQETLDNINMATFDSVSFDSFDFSLASLRQDSLGSVLPSPINFGEEATELKKKKTRNWRMS